MARIDNITDFLEAGLRAETVRQKTIAGNVANLQTPEYKSTEIKFEDMLEKALSGDGDFDPRGILPEIYEPLQTKVNANGNDVSLEIEIGRMIKNAMKHTAYVRLLNKKYQQIQQAIEIK